ncbi:MAG TPA: cyclohexa-1,5-dienecarbonyl-CoA hydratase [Alphaproteobacteria bacterium]|jgi:cyclohexa-1,5-dienecarbonyl-CoA hydratase|nr:cyclohexa-1,5-dienecarbonyl-CoA hydratase [Alphaproteobacteria bacterium]MDP6268757.1 cyclohexa-1,5-dienecarbonyl-CoA hydratase [Alphaproteobacteria bacterium]HJM49190.1 cyclohexa-1,5-dienecarbonyl-CoA hydratase [Alphaproteobacteria bacterium]
MSDPALKVWLDREGRLLRLRLNRPKANIVDAEMIAALAKALAEHAETSGLAAVLLDAEGPNFSFGASVEEHLPAEAPAMLAGLHALVLRMAAYPLPIIVAVQGQCLGGGLELALAGHLIFCAEDARLGQPEIKLAVFAPAASVLLAARVGRAQAADILFSGRSLRADEAKAMGLVNEVAGDPGEAALAYFDKHLAGLSSAALKVATKALAVGQAEDLKAKLDAVEKLYLEDLMATHDGNEGLQAFIEKRQPKWEHR